jgi:hypothetical protein
MHMFAELINGCTSFTLSALKEANDKTIDALQTSGATSLVKSLQMIQLQKAIFGGGNVFAFRSHIAGRAKL